VRISIGRHSFIDGPDNTQAKTARRQYVFMRAARGSQGRVGAQRGLGRATASQDSSRSAGPEFAKVSTMNLVVMCAAVFLGLIVCLEIGYRLGAKRVKIVANAFEGFGAIEGAVFGIFGLLLSLTFFGAASRLDARRQLIVNEANAIASAYLRVDLLPNSEQPEVRRLFRQYLDERIRISESSDEAQALAEMPRAVGLQQAIWSHAISATKEGTPGTPLLLPALNQMNEIASAKAIAVQMHLPALVFYFLLIAALLSGLVAGFGMARGHRNWVSVLTYAALVTLTMYVMLDMEYPRAGLIRIGAADRALTNLRDSIQ
jgi:hypothetical protein